jgi:hypothetical protein
MFLFAIQTIPYQSNRKRGGQWYSDTFPFSIPWLNACFNYRSAVHVRLGNYEKALTDIELALKESIESFFLKNEGLGPTL